MRALQLSSLAELAKPIRGLRVLLWGFSGPGFPGGDGAIEAAAVLPQVGIETTYSHQKDPGATDKLAKRYDVAIIANTRVARVLNYDPRLWQCAKSRVYWFWDLRPGGVAKPLRGYVDHVFISYNGVWTAPNGSVFDPARWHETLDCPVGYCPQAAPLRQPVRGPDGAHILFIGDLANGMYHSGRSGICRAMGAKVLNSRNRPGRLAIEHRMPELYRSARYVLSMSPRAPGYTSVRTYSILACGGLMLLHRFPGADELFIDGDDAVLFDTVEDLQARLKDLDGDPRERERIAANGRKLHAEKHTLAHRALSICAEVTGVSKGFNGWR